MSDPDRLAEAMRAGGALLRELDQARDLADERGREVARLRDLLARWARAAGRCFGCNAERGQQHDPGCELAAALASANGETAATPKDDGGS